MSWLLFIIFGGIGLPALPLDFIYAFCTRPKKISKQEVDSKRAYIVMEAKHLKEACLEIKTAEDDDIMKKSILNKERRAFDSKLRRLKALVHVLDTVNFVLNNLGI